MDPQALLADSLRTHLGRVGAGLDGTAADPSDDPPDEASELCAVVVVRDLDPAAFVRGTLEFAQAVPAPLRDPWYRTFTRTLFFAGNPVSVAERFSCRHLAGGEIGWLGPGERRAYLGLSRMLRLFRGPAPPRLPATLELTVPGAAPSDRAAALRVATAGVSTGEYLVHVNHTLSEAALRGLIAPGDLLAVTHTDELDPTEVESLDGERSQLRIAEDARRPGRLRLYAALAADRSLALTGGDRV
ncbi:MAG: DUF6182 family protein [Solirubrobacterales bacterium]